MVEQLITEHLDLWTSAHTTRSTSGRSSRNKLELTGIKKLRELILELATRGKIVPQNSEEEPASDMLARVAAERERLIKEKKIKKPTSLKEIQAAEHPFELPTGWQFAKLGLLVEMYNGRAFKSSEWGSSGLPIVRIQNLNDTTASFNYYAGSVDEKNRIDTGTFLISWSGTPGTSFGAFIWDRGEAALNQHINKCVFFADELDLRYIQLAVNGQMNHFIANAQGGVGLKHVTKGTLNNAILGIPPKKEQARIVAKVDELMALCDQLEQRTEASVSAHQILVETLIATLTDSADANELAQNWARLVEHFDTLFTTEHSLEQLKQTILQLAVIGKLVSQDPREGTASDLIEAISVTKSQLVKDGKLKKARKTAAIENSLELAQLPDNWSWCRTIDLCEFITDGEHNTPERTNDSSEVPLVTAKNVRDGYLDYTNTDYVPINAAEKCWFRCHPKKNDILMVSVGATTGRLSVLEETKDMVLVRSVTVFRPISVNPNYFALCIQSPFGQRWIWQNVRQSAQPCLYLSKSSALPIPLPPLKEQVRIVKKVEQLLNLCHELKEEIEAAKSLNNDIATVLVKHSSA